MSKIVIAPDSFKGSLTSKQAAEIMSGVLISQLPDVEIIQCPLADGGEGTADLLSPYLTDSTCLIESAQFLGLNLPEMQSLDVMQRSSDLLGQVILAGLNAGKREFVIGLGGSAINDCGLGMLMALGLEARDKQGSPVEANLAGLLSIKSINISDLDPRLAESRLTILNDVESPLCGKKGATAVYGPQKGLRKSDVERIDSAFNAFADLCADALGVDPRLQPGAGAAGGLGFALMLLGGEMVSGADYVIAKAGLREKLSGVDWVITGEGCSDAQTLQGKLPLKVAQTSRAAGAKVALISGSVDREVLPDLEKSFDLVVSAMSENMSVDQAVCQAEPLLVVGTQRLLEKIML